jgi:hypothetical protein
LKDVPASSDAQITKQTYKEFKDSKKHDIKEENKSERNGDL